jgi:hypothetical protein
MVYRREQWQCEAHGPGLEAMYRFTLWLVPTVEKFPRGQKFLLGDREYPDFGVR